MKRVYIEPVRRADGSVKVYLVRYVERRRGQRYLAAQFERLDSLMVWLEKQPNLELVVAQ